MPFDRWDTKPFVLEPFGFGVPAPSNSQGTNRAENRRHPIHKASAWQKALEEQPWLTREQIGENEGISRGRVRQILQLLLLPENAVQFLKSLENRRDVMFFNERKLRSIVAAEPEQRAKRFEDLKYSWTQAKR